MAPWEPGDATPSAAADRLARDIAGMYGQAEQALVAEIARIIRTHGGGREPLPMAERLAALREMRLAAQRVVGILDQNMPDLAEQIVAEAARSGTQAATAQLHAVADLTPGILDRIARVLPGLFAAEAIAADLSSKLDAVHLRILRFPDDAYRAAIASTAPDVALGFVTSRVSSRNAWDRLMAQGITGFTDRAGRNWNLATYTEMATRTAVIRAYSDAGQMRMAQAGVDMYTVIVGNDACQKCAKYAGSILSNVGPVGDVLVEHATIDGQYLTVHVADTVTGATEQGWRHPNCRCTLVAFFPGLRNPATVTKSNYDPQMEADREHLRALERKVRKAKLAEAGALTPDDAKAARADIRGLQARIRQHIADTGLMRQRDREQLDYGFSTRWRPAS